VSNILNLTDGVLGEALNIHVIATFNTEKENIDEALLRSGRLIAEHKFDKLNVEDSNKLLEKLGKSHRTDKPMPLCDIYTADLDQIRSEKGEKKIGFGR
jgi:ATP-dependent 26S proteasome regulatory subunit